MTPEEILELALHKATERSPSGGIITIDWFSVVQALKTYKDSK